jgi:glucosamine--fructose-6-phosphate aminotransferase (isomerizing)
MAVDIAEQPEVYARLIEPAAADRIAAVAAVIARRRPRHVVFAAHGSCGHAARYAGYLAQVRLGLAAGRVAPSAITLFGARPELSGALVIGVDQRGGAPDLSEVVRVARAGGALTVAVTNDPGSALATTAELVIDLAAGPERAVAATKTYTAALLALAMLLEGVRTGDGTLPPGERATLAVLPELAALTLADPAAPALAGRYRWVDRVVVTGCGYAYPTAREAALKLMETSNLAALSCSGAELLPGPLALTHPDVPVLAVVGEGPGGAAMRGVLGRLGGHRADVVVVGPAAVPGVAAQLRVPALDERHAPLLDILPLQRFALALALARGEDPDHPRGLARTSPAAGT